MRGVKNRESGKGKKLARFLALFLVLGFLLNSVGKVYQKKKDAEEILARMQKEKAELEERSQELEGTLSRLGTKEGVDFEIRKRFNVAGAGEGVAIIVDEIPNASTTPARTSTWQKIKNFFSDWFK